MYQKTPIFEIPFYDKTFIIKVKYRQTNKMIPDKFYLLFSRHNRDPNFLFMFYLK